jgi:hypothetical protein
MMSVLDRHRAFRAMLDPSLLGARPGAPPHLVRSSYVQTNSSPASRTRKRSTDDDHFSWDNHLRDRHRDRRGGSVQRSASPREVQRIAVEGDAPGTSGARPPAPAPTPCSRLLIAPAPQGRRGRWSARPRSAPNEHEQRAEPATVSLPDCPATRAHHDPGRLTAGDRGDQVGLLFSVPMPTYRTFSGMWSMAYRTCVASSTAAVSPSFEFCFKASATSRTRWS